MTVMHNFVLKIRLLSEKLNDIRYSPKKEGISHGICKIKNPENFK